MARNGKREESQATEDITGTKKYLDLFPNGIYAAEGNFPSGRKCFVKNDEFAEREISTNNLCWSVSASKSKESGQKIIKVEAVPNNRYYFPQKEAWITVYLVNKDVQVWTKQFDLTSFVDKQTIVIDADQETSLVDIFDDVRIKVGIYSAPDGYVTDNYGTQSILFRETRAHDAVLLIGDKKFYVIKKKSWLRICTILFRAHRPTLVRSTRIAKYLSSWSNFFNKMFSNNNDGSDNGKNEFRIEDVNSDDFDLLLRIIHANKNDSITFNNVHSMLKLASKFEMPSVLGKCGKFLQNFENCRKMKLIERLEIADKHKLISLQAAILRKLHSGSIGEYEGFMTDNKERIKKLSVYTYKNIATLC